jgi:Uma2 family endonuclease
MTKQQPLRLTADAFLAWAGEQPQGRYELAAGEVVAMAPERADHVRVKLSAVNALEAALGEKRLACETLLDGVGVQTDEATLYIPDVIVRCGPPIPGDTMVIDDPVILVEVLSPSTRALDSGVKLGGYFRLASLRHYLVIDSDARSVTHHTRPDPEGDITTRILREGVLALDPPGIAVPCEAFFARL